MIDGTDAGPPKDIQQQLAEERTEIARRRTLLAEERTYSAWVRTGLASLGTGFVIAKLIPNAEPTWMTRGLGILFVAAGGAMFALALWAYRRAVRQMQEPVQGGIPIWIVATITGGLGLGTLAALALIFVD